jgi:hypothetical protein
MTGSHWAFGGSRGEGKFLGSGKTLQEHTDWQNTSRGVDLRFLKRFRGRMRKGAHQPESRNRTGNAYSEGPYDGFVDGYYEDKNHEVHYDSNQSWGVTLRRYSTRGVSNTRSCFNRILCITRT